MRDTSANDADSTASTVADVEDVEEDLILQDEKLIQLICGVNNAQKKAWI